MLNEIDSLKVARYLIEDNDDRFVEFSMLTEGLIARAKSILKNLIGKYTILEVINQLILEKWRGIVIFWDFNNTIEI